MRTLNRCSGEPILSWPCSIIGDSGHLPATPKYLFHTYDAKRSGRSDDTLVASSASTYQAEINRTDLLSLNQGNLAHRLCAHLGKSCFVADNLMSWSSSLLAVFIVQFGYAAKVNCPQPISIFVRWTQQNSPVANAELHNPYKRTKWSRSLLHLRNVWTDSRASSHRELRIASDIATRCFRDFHPSELAMSLLKFRTVNG